MAKIPGYVDFGGIEFVRHDSVSEVPQIMWKVTDYANGSTVLPEFYVRTTLEDGLAGIGVVDSLNEPMSEPILIPQLTSKNAEHLEIFKGISSPHWQKITAAVVLLEQMLLSRGQSLQSSGEFDYGFWQNSIATLVATIKRLPTTLRYQQVKLKRELQNPDYEHLWIELYDVEFGEYKCPKLEFRLSASMIETGGFSKLPKLEFPLVNGKSKPFDSWFPESVDDFGKKFELRFSLENRVFDVGTFLRLSEADQRMMQSLILAIYPQLKGDFSLSYAQIGFITLMFQLTASLLQPLIGSYTDKHPQPRATGQPLCVRARLSMSFRSRCRML
jgi:hypothetical protein